MKDNIRLLQKKCKGIFKGHGRMYESIIFINEKNTAKKSILSKVIYNFHCKFN